jgi:1-deoxy-D-xylulose-5-phosphate synthase
VLFAIDRGGLVGADGATHNGSFDLSYLRALPNIIVMAPADENECRKMLTTGFLLNGPTAVRYPRGSGTGVAIEADLEPIEVGKAEVRRKGRRVALLAFGTLLAPALDAGEAFDATVVNMRFVKPLDEELLLELARTHDVLVTIEENAVAGGAGSAVNEYLAAAGVVCRTVNLGLPDRFIEQGDPKQLLAECGLDAAGIRRTLLRELSIEGISRAGIANT